MSWNALTITDYTAFNSLTNVLAVQLNQETIFLEKVLSSKTNNGGSNLFVGDSCAFVFLYDLN